MEKYILTFLSSTSGVMIEELLPLLATFHGMYFCEVIKPGLISAVFSDGQNDA
jgi:hypothetical protein